MTGFESIRTLHRLQIIEADAFKWTPPNDMRFTVGWHDIWDNPIGEDVETEEHDLLDHHGLCCAWQGT